MTALQRIVVVGPAVEGSSGYPMRALHDIYRKALVDLGVEVFDVPLGIFFPPDAARIAEIVEALKAFKPQAAISLSISSYLINCRLPPGRDGWRPNLFTDVLDIPTICIWDHAPLDFAAQLFGPPVPATPDDSRAGALAELRRTLTHPRLIHWSRDSFQTALMRRFGFLGEGRLFHETPPTLPGFVCKPKSATASKGVAFIGHLHQSLPELPAPELAELERDVTDDWLGDLGQPAWNLLELHAARLSETDRRRLALDPDQTFFWRFANRLLAHHAQTRVRLEMLGSAGVPVTVYGNLQPKDAPANLVPVPGYVPFGPPLADLLARHEIIIDVLSPAFANGFGHRSIIGFTSGGFVLMSRKQDFIETYGELGEAVSFANAEELATKIDLYLGKPALRREIAAALSEKILAHRTLSATLSRVLEFAREEIAGQARRPAPEKRAASVPILDLLLRMQRWGRWPWDPAQLQRGPNGVTISCRASDWGYAARIALPPQVRGLREPHLRLELTTETGRIGVGLLGGSGGPVSEQFIGPSNGPVTVVLELPSDAHPQVILRKTSDAPVRAVVSGAVLCDRPA